MADGNCGGGVLVMYELHQITDRCSYIDCPAKVGVVKLSDGEVCLVDAGSDKDAGRKVRQILDRQGWKLRAVYNTHSNADHIGGDRYLQSQTGCDVFAPGIEAAFTRYPVLEASFLYGGFPPKDLRHKFLLAQESEAKILTQAELPECMTLLPLPGHFFDMAGFRTEDGVVYLADCLSSEETLRKYRICFIYDVAAYLETLDRVLQMSARMFVPAHAAATDDIAPLARLNIEAVNEIADKIVSLCGEPIIFEEILQKLFSDFGLTMNFEQYVLVGSTVRSYLAWLRDGDRLEILFENGRMLWRAL